MDAHVRRILHADADLAPAVHVPSRTRLTRAAQRRRLAQGCTALAIAGAATIGVVAVLPMVSSRSGVDTVTPAQTAAEPSAKASLAAADEVASLVADIRRVAPAVRLDPGSFVALDPLVDGGGIATGRSLQGGASGFFSVGTDSGGLLRVVRMVVDPAVDETSVRQRGTSELDVPEDTPAAYRETSGDGNIVYAYHNESTRRTAVVAADAQGQVVDIFMQSSSDRAHLPLQDVVELAKQLLNSR